MDKICFSDEEIQGIYNTYEDGYRHHLETLERIKNVKKSDFPYIWKNIKYNFYALSRLGLDIKIILYRGIDKLPSSTGRINSYIEDDGRFVESEGTCCIENELRKEVQCE